LSKISEGADKRLEAAWLAPSGLNAQNWYFIADSGKIHCYRKRPLVSFYDKMGCIDIGIAICHIAQESEGFVFLIGTDAPVRKGYVHMGTVK
jgi:hypothetical protein